MPACHAIAAVLLIGFPLWDHWEAKRLRFATHPKQKTAFYQRAIAGLWFVCLAVILCRPLATLWPAPVGVIPFLDLVPDSMAQGVIIGLILAAVAPPVLAWVHVGLRRNLLVPYEKLDYMLPVSPRRRSSSGQRLFRPGSARRSYFAGFSCAIFSGRRGGFPSA